MAVLPYLFMTNCTDNSALDANTPPITEKEQPASLSFSIEMSKDANTRALSEKTEFASGDEIGIYIYKKGSSTVINSYSNIKTTVRSDKKSLSFPSTPVITEDVDVKAYYPYRNGGDYTTLPPSGTFPYMATATASQSSANVTLTFTKNISKITMTLINCPDFKTAKKYGSVLGAAVSEDEIEEFSSNTGGWKVYKITKYVSPGTYADKIIYSNTTTYETPKKTITLKAAKEYKYNYNFRSKVANVTLIESEEDFKKISGEGKNYSQIKDISPSSGTDISNCIYDGNGFKLSPGGFAFTKANNGTIESPEIRNVYIYDSYSTNGLIRLMNGGSISGCKRNNENQRYIYDYSESSEDNVGLGHSIHNATIEATVIDLNYHINGTKSHTDRDNVVCGIANSIENNKYIEVSCTPMYIAQRTATGTYARNENINSYESILCGVRDGISPYNSENQYTIINSSVIERHTTPDPNTAYYRFYAQYKLTETIFDGGSYVDNDHTAYRFERRKFESPYWLDKNQGFADEPNQNSESLYIRPITQFYNFDVEGIETWSVLRNMVY